MFAYFRQYGLQTFAKWAQFSIIQRSGPGFANPGPQSCEMATQP
jgi:hypothetical protein